MSTYKCPQKHTLEQSWSDALLSAITDRLHSRMFVGVRLLPIVLFILLQANVGTGIRIGRIRVTIRRICREIDCRWGGWSGWGVCNHPCGNAGVESRSRGIRRKSKCGGRSCSGPSTQTRPCNRFCDHGGTPQRGHCSNCPAEYWGTCCSYRK